MLTFFSLFILSNFILIVVQSTPHQRNRVIPLDIITTYHQHSKACSIDLALNKLENPTCARQAMPKPNIIRAKNKLSPLIYFFNMIQNPTVMMTVNTLQITIPINPINPIILALLTLQRLLY